MLDKTLQTLQNYNPSRIVFDLIKDNLLLTPEVICHAPTKTSELEKIYVRMCVWICLVAGESHYVNSPSRNSYLICHASTSRIQCLTHSTADLSTPDTWQDYHARLFRESPKFMLMSNE